MSVKSSTPSGGPNSSLGTRNCSLGWDNPRSPRQNVAMFRDVGVEANTHRRLKLEIDGIMVGAEKESRD